MAAYSAVISLLQTIEQLQERNPKLIREASNNTKSYPEKIKCLEEKIRVAANDAEDVVELKIGQIIKGLSWKFGLALIILGRNLLSVVEKIDTTKKEVIEIVSDFGTSTHANDEVGTTSRSNTMLPNLEDAIVQGLDDDLEIIVD
ncbi:hypothetical protein K7X08_026305 [Anisodus acutangulus]|uniref:Uncharacterized protein n=1 Tax=Anisodus acutangulus TaxID=402998 RepID=A0A9Q1LLL2_9SOLA|nr:hypothetical protein K7X08_026305 [Anisodus acutangulus]